ncbi:hypothetical protein FRC09_001275 [Ceratobasidium sp. 395]|nr:hypothetical protein FRC09_001275 [Ceratobasidium sp. 395]
MSAASSDEFDFTEFTEEDLSQIDSIADVALASDATVWPMLYSSIEPTTNLEESQSTLPETCSRSRKSSGYSVFDLTEEELRLLDKSVAHLEPGHSIQLSPRNEPPSIASARSIVPHIEISLESPLPSTLADSPAPTLGRDSSLSPAHTTQMSLYSQFRLSRNSLSVSDLVGPAWCELQFDYGLRGGRHLPASQRPAVLQSRTGKVIPVQKDVAAKNDVIKKGGTAVHKKLEREIRPTEIMVTTETREDKWGLKLLDMLSNIRILIDEGRCREMPVMGFIHGHFVSGVIRALKDEITRIRVTPPSPTSPIVPGHFPSANPSSTSTTPSHTIHILDNKTRGVPSIPKPRDSYQSRLQLMLYKRLLDGLLGSPLSPNHSSPSPSPPLSTHFSFSAIWDHHSVDPSESFSARFLEESALLVLSNQLGPSATKAKCLKDLEHAWEEIAEELVESRQTEDKDGVVSRRLKLVYRLRERAGKLKKRPTAPSSSSSDAGPSSRGKSPSRDKARRGSKKLRGDSEDVELQRAIQASLHPSPPKVENEIQEAKAEVMREEEKDAQVIEDASEVFMRTPGSWISTNDELQRAIRDSLATYKSETGREASPPSCSLAGSQSPGRRPKQDSDENIIGTVEFDHDDATLDQHLNGVLDFWHDRRAPKGVALEDTGRCTYCEFAEGCEWLEAKAAELVTRTKRSNRR